MVSLEEMEKAWQSGEIGESFESKKKWFEAQKNKEAQTKEALTPEHLDAIRSKEGEEREKAIWDLTKITGVTYTKILAALQGNKPQESPKPNLKVVDIPQYHNLRFCKVRHKTKKPCEKDWVNKPYTYEEINEYRAQETNYGVICGYSDLIVIDCDEQELHDAARKDLPLTFEVITGSGGTHCYYFCPELKKKLVLTNEVKHYGEVQSYGAQVIGVTSLHPNGKTYDILQDLPIQTITLEQLMNCVSSFMSKPEEEKMAQENYKFFGSDDKDDINSLPITSIINTAGFKKSKNGEIYGPNPWHGSATGINFWINPSKNIANCFRCNAGVSVAKAIALNEGIIKNCNDELRGDKFKRTLEIAESKHGLKRKNYYANVDDLFDKLRAMQNADKTKFVDDFGAAFKEEALQHSMLRFTHEFSKKHPFYYDRAGLWWVWNHQTKCWKLVDEVDVLNSVHTTTSFDTINSKMRGELLQALKQVGRLIKPLDVPSYWIQFQNGIVDASSIESNLVEPTPQYFTINPIPHKIGNSEETPMLDKLFNEWVGPEWANTLYEIMAFSLLSTYPINRMFFLYGGGSNGKSTFLEILMKFVGLENCTTTELDLLTTNRFEVTKLHKKLLCLMGESNLSALAGTSIIKKLCGRDLISFEYKYAKNSIQERNYAKLIIATNNIPPTDDKTIGFYRRIITIDFPNQFPEKRDILAEIPESEYENLGRKSIRIIKELLNSKEFTNEGTIEQKMKRYEDRSNPFDKFWKECIEEDVETHISKKKFFEVFSTWCKANRFREVSEVMVAKHMKERRIIDEKMTMQWIDTQGGPKPRYYAWVGIRFKDGIHK